MKSALMLAAFLLASCAPVQTPAPPPPSSIVEGVRLSASVEGRRSVRLILDNGTRDPIAYNLCRSRLQQMDAGGWSSVETGEVCTLEMRTLNPGFDATFDKSLPSSLPAGDYRYVTSVEAPADTPQREVASNTFRIPR